MPKLDVQELGQRFLEYFRVLDRTVDFRFLNMPENYFGGVMAGRCINMNDHSTIDLFPEVLHRVAMEGYRIGGNFTVPNSQIEAVALCLTHEIRHVMQFIGSGHPTWLTDRPYWFQPHEIDARSFTDSRQTDARLLIDGVGLVW